LLILVREVQRDAAIRNEIRYHRGNAVGRDSWDGVVRLRIIDNSGVNETMAKEPQATDSTTPKKSTRKPKIEADNGIQVVKMAATTAAKPKKTKEVAMAQPVEEKIRMRAYELYLQRHGQGGSPEQDWFQAAAEIYGESVA
jgi:hypothetical protein